MDYFDRLREVIDQTPECFTHDETIVPPDLMQRYRSETGTLDSDQVIARVRAKLIASMELQSDPLGHRKPDFRQVVNECNAMIAVYVLKMLREGATLRDLRANLGFAEIIGTVSHGTAAINLSARTLYHIARQWQHGRQIYYVSRGLSDVLERTDVGDVACDELQLPYPSIYLKVDPHDELRFWDRDTAWHRLVGVYLSIDTFVDGGRELNAMIVGERKGPDGDSLCYWSLPLAPTLTVDYCVGAQKARDSWPSVDGLEPIWRWIINVLIYATSAEARSEIRPVDPRAQKLREKMLASRKPKRRRALGSELSRMDQRRYTVLGPGIGLDRSSGKGSGLAEGHWVAGHWKRQAHGPGRAKRKRILIEPYYRGPEGQEAVPTVHRMR